MDNMTPKERVFGTLRNLQRLVDEAEDMAAIKGRLAVAIDRCLSWESELADLNAVEPGPEQGMR
ncbi:hypothetical protein [Pseudomonas paeninsulae]|uniref:hypothetical protein n=1 Tax=Pseudomonas paeninsulae TaxID=3110772 RepID=UPI002D770DD1|nr:hypothetical protein [Pseudomonas sp. IT1137]